MNTNPTNKLLIHAAVQSLKEARIDRINSIERLGDKLPLTSKPMIAYVPLFAEYYPGREFETERFAACVLIHTIDSEVVPRLVSFSKEYYTDRETREEWTDNSCCVWDSREGLLKDINPESEDLRFRHARRGQTLFKNTVSICHSWVNTYWRAMSEELMTSDRKESYPQGPMATSYDLSSMPAALTSAAAGKSKMLRGFIEGGVFLLKPKDRNNYTGD